jgi:hypothetical protein
MTDEHRALARAIGAACFLFGVLPSSWSQAEAHGIRHYRSHHHRHIRPHLRYWRHVTKRHATFQRFEHALARPTPTQDEAVDLGGHEIERSGLANSSAQQTAPALPIINDVLAQAGQYLGDGNVTGHRGLPWCAFFLNKVLRETGHHFVNSGRAIDARLIGPPTYAHPGAVAYTHRHTAFVAKVDHLHGRVLLLGGNQGHRVSYSWHSMRGMRFSEPT